MLTDRGRFTNVPDKILIGIVELCPTFENLSRIGHVWTGVADVPDSIGVGVYVITNAL